MWDATASANISAVDSAVAYDPATAAAYYGTEWGAYPYDAANQYDATTDYGEAPPGVDYQPAEVNSGHAALQNEWGGLAQASAESGITEAIAEAGQGSAPSAAAQGTESDATPVDTSVASGLEQPGNFAQYPGSTTGYDYSAYAAGQYFDPNAAYNGTNGYQYGHGHHAYGHADYYTAAYAAAAAAPKEIRNPFEDLAKPKDEKTEQPNVWPQRRGGPARKKIIMGLPKKIESGHKTKPAAETASADSLDPSKPTTATVSSDSLAVHELIDSITGENSQGGVQPESVVPSVVHEKENMKEHGTNVIAKEVVVPSISPPMKLQSFSAPTQKVRITQVEESDDDSPLSDSEQPKRSTAKGAQQRADIAMNAARSLTMTSSEISSRSAAAEALAAAKNAAANIMQREGYDRRAPLKVNVAVALPLPLPIKISVASAIPKTIAKPIANAA
ncbi:hypothetical protein HDU86_002147 [Geranomyces michiganensis]|nr:hypothetical protein HDU86_002147 [Geranomyces michiganensis]